MRWPQTDGAAVCTFGFPANCEIRILPGLPYAGTPYHDVSPKPGKLLIRAGLVVQVTTSDGTAWIGNFERGWGGLEGVGHTVDPNLLLVIAGGQGYFVAVNDPSRRTTVAIGVIRDAVMLPEGPWFVFASDVALASYSGTGEFRWSGRIAVDDLHLADIEGTTLRGTGWDSVTTFEFVVDARTGECTYLTPLCGAFFWPYHPGRRYAAE